VFLRSTMPWNNCSSRSRSAFRTTSSMWWWPRGDRQALVPLIPIV